MGLILYRASDDKINKEIESTTPKEVYASFNDEQFREFIKLYLKNAVMNPEKNVSMMTISEAKRREINDFFESLPDYLLDFSNDSNRRLAMMYITSNLQYSYGVQFGDAEYDCLHGAMMRIKEVDPRINSK